ncbi:MAG: hypothetical protein Q8S14_19375 [Algoriphagus sp.]|uniref:hypothetical protein n=1 Tax=Algoriphagus sp. TaxID=1872435 RepID=UPI002730FF7F|nr:hypothetical protein [Algoriphagus sp.]MDP2042664.1 hypothetical protein [Algoriphagus sp.]MDP3474039.1 hypothetical protein [Algoriphagus sp.]
MNYFELHDLYNVAKIIYHPEFKEGDLIMGSQERLVKDLSLYKIHTQQIKASGKIQDFYRPSSNLSMRVIVSSRAKSLLESYRKDNIRYYPCPVHRGKEPIEGYWITDKVIFDDEWVDFTKSEFFFRKRKLISEKDEPRARYEVTEQIIQFTDLEDYNKFLKEKMWHMDERYPYKIFIREGCPHHILSIHTTGPRYLIVSEELKNELQKHKLDKGIEFKPLEIPDEEWGGPNGLRKQFYK